MCEDGIYPGGVPGRLRFPLLGAEEGDSNQGPRSRARDRKGRLYVGPEPGQGGRAGRPLPGQGKR